MSDQELIFKNEKDFQPIFKKLIRKVKRLQFENSQPLDYQEAEDIAQQALINIARTRAETKIEYLTSYLYTTVENLYKNLMKKKIKSVTTVAINENDEEDSRKNSPLGYDKNQSQLKQIDTMRIFKSCISKLTRKQYQVLYFQVSGGDEEKRRPMKQKDLSHMMGIPLGTLKPLLIRAKKALGDCIKKQNAAAEGAS